MTFKDIQPGRKTYAAAILLALYAILGVVVGDMDLNEAWPFLLNALGLAGIRAAIK